MIKFGESRLRARRLVTCTVALFVAVMCAAVSTAGATAAASPKAHASAASVPRGCQPSKTSTLYPGLAGKPVTVAVTPLSPPYIYTSPSNPNKIIGFEADLLTDWTNCLGLTYKWDVYQDFGSMVPAVQSGRDDVIQSSIFATPVRAKQVNFVVYMKSYTGSIVAKGNPDHINSLGDICGKTVAEVVGGVEVGIAQAQSKACVKAGKPAVQLSLYKDNSLAEQQVIDGRADIWMVDAGLASVIAKKFSSQIQTSYSINSGLKIGTAINKSDVVLQKAVFASLKQLQADGIIKQLLTKWGIRANQAIPVAKVN
jgi:polar amino acid transport system substrate-binding protein